MPTFLVIEALACSLPLALCGGVWLGRWLEREQTAIDTERAQ